MESNITTTGILRRVDELGRVVLPKEIRKSLRIKETDLLEIYKDREGSVILRKHSPLQEAFTLAKQCADNLAKVSGYIALIADRDQVIAVSGGGKIFCGATLSRHLENVINERETLLSSKEESGFVPLFEGKTADYCQEAVTPILCRGDVIGCVILLGEEAGKKMKEAEEKLIRLTAGFLGCNVLE